ncbi:MAG: SGNH/GDSL hydrolase family protein [Cyanobacteria bacterium P01_E01_bin.6]
MGREVVWVGLAVLAVVVVVVDISLRRLFGFGNPLLYVADEQIGYLLAPNQDVRRFGNRILINDYSMRGEAIAPTRSSDTLRVLIVGDSIANGGWWTDHDETISARLQHHLATSLENLPFKTAEVLNASANSWGPRNELAYIRAYSCFEAQVLVLLINTDDLFATEPTPVQVGRDRNYPARRPPFALAEVIGRYVLPPASIPELEVVRAEGGDRVGKNLEAIRQIQSIVTQQGGHLVLVMTPLLRELGSPGPRDYELDARDRLTVFTQQHQIPYLDMLSVLNTQDDPAQLYRDHIHFNADGNQLIAGQMMSNVLERAIALR